MVNRHELWQKVPADCQCRGTHIFEPVITADIKKTHQKLIPQKQINHHSPHTIMIELPHQKNSYYQGHSVKDSDL